MIRPKRAVLRDGIDQFGGVAVLIPDGFVEGNGSDFADAVGRRLTMKGDGKVADHPAKEGFGGGAGRVVMGQLPVNMEHHLLFDVFHVVGKKTGASGQPPGMMTDRAHRIRVDAFVTIA